MVDTSHSITVMPGHFHGHAICSKKNPKQDSNCCSGDCDQTINKNNCFVSDLPNKTVHKTAYSMNDEFSVENATGLRLLLSKAVGIKSMWSDESTFEIFLINS